MTQKKCPTCGQQVIADPRQQLLAYLRARIKGAEMSVGVADAALQNDKYPGNLAGSRRNLLEKYKSWLAVVETDAANL